MNISGKSLDSLLDEILDGILKEDQQTTTVPAVPPHLTPTPSITTNKPIDDTIQPPAVPSVAPDNKKSTASAPTPATSNVTNTDSENITTSSFLGKTVVVKNLQARSELNGEMGIVQEDLNNGRVKVYLLRTGSSISIKHENIILSNTDNEVIEEVNNTDSTATTTHIQSPSAPRTHAQSALWSFTSTTRQWENKQSFYPFGNTSARLLTSHIPISQPVINLLLLACNDFRHILYTLWCITQQSTAGAAATTSQQTSLQQQALNFVVVDLEPSTLARNILLLYMLYSGNYSMKRLWMVFYSRVIDDRCLQMIVSNCEALLQTTGSDVQSWHGTEFGKLVRFCNQSTYTAVRLIWEVYRSGKLSAEKDAAMKATMTDACSNNKESGGGMGSVMQAQPCVLEAFQNSHIHSKVAHQYQEGKDVFSSIYGSKLEANQCHGNPLLCRGIQQHVDLHFGLDPTCGYHLALAYAHLSNNNNAASSNGNNGNNGGNVVVDKERLLQVCFTEFSDWCQSFRMLCVKPTTRVKIHVFAGDAMDFCQDLMTIRTFGSSEKLGYMGNGDLRATGLLKEFPMEYDVIDTSHLSDKMGLLNMLLVCRNALKPNSNSVVFTDLSSSSSSSSNNTNTNGAGHGHGHHSGGNLEEMLEELLCMNLTTLSTLTGITLAPSVHRCSTNFHNFASTKLLSPNMLKRKELQLEWKLISAHNCIRMEMAPTDFVYTLSEVYRRMFALYLGLANSLLEDTTSLEQFVQNAFKLSHGQHDLAQPGVQLFARLVRIASEHLFQVKKDTILALLSEVRHCGQYGQSNYAQEMFVWFTLFGLIEMTDLQDMITGVIQGYTLSWKSSRLLYFARSTSGSGANLVRHAGSHMGIAPPKLVLVTLLVPKATMQEQLSKLSSPILEMSVCAGMTTQNGFNSFHLGYVKQVLRPGDHNKAATTDQQGSSSVDPSDTVVQYQHFALVSGTAQNYQYVACSAVVPISALVIDAPANIRVELRLHYSMVRKSREIIKMFGPLLVLHSAALSDSKQVSWCPYEDHLVAVVPPSLPVMYQHISNRNKLTLQPDNTTNIANMSPMECHGIREVQFTSLAVTPAVLKGEDNGHFQCKLSFEDASILATCHPEFISRPCPFQIRLLLQVNPSMQFVDLRLSVAMDVMQSKIQISRSKGFINLLLTPIKEASQYGPDSGISVVSMFRENLCLSQFQISGLPRVSLEAMPKVNCSSVDGSKLNWLSTIAVAQLDHKERYAESAVKTALGSWKETVHAIMMYFTGQQEPGVYKRLFGLAASAACGVEIVLFVNCIRLDFFAHSIVLDVAICVVEFDKAGIVSPWCDGFENKTGLCTLKVSTDEMLLWKEMLPALAERTRRNFEHVHGRCEYCATGSSGSAGGDFIPRYSYYLSPGQPVVCSCVLGKGLEHSEFEAALGGRYKPVYNQFFRAAISPIFNAFETTHHKDSNNNKTTTTSPAKVIHSSDNGSVVSSNEQQLGVTSKGNQQQQQQQQQSPP